MLELRALSLAVPGRVLFEDVSARLDPGILHAVMGPSGSGKTTLLSAIGGSWPVRCGEIVYNSIAHERLSSSVCWVPQGSNALAHRTALDNVMLGSLSRGRTVKEAKGDAHEALERVGLSDKAPIACSRLSGGELQRVALSRALVTGRPILLADEPTGALDRVNADVVTDAMLGAAAEGRIVVIATHDSRVSERCGTVLRLGD